MSTKLWADPPVPEGHVSAFAQTVERPRHKIEISDLLGAGLLEPGQKLIPRQAQFHDRVVTVLSDGRLEIDGTSFGSPSGAANYVTGVTRNGWTYFVFEGAPPKVLNDLWHEYVDLTSADADDSAVDDDDQLDEGTLP